MSLVGRKTERTGILQRKGSREENKGNRG